ncbi:hypothetical protein SDC9_89646 [bioreactor metagenome]|uniref:Uncharacterized protein n=1 Tax=bioreactor metagenome TaxID=1076179 RepID=A0A644ZZH8_9ZZZZ|nr:hypothetical protein [Oscillospiraceae bacterium]
MSNIITACLILFAVIPVASVIYYLIYKIAINRALIGAENHSRRLPSPLAFFVAAVMIAFLILSAVFIISKIKSDNINVNENKSYFNFTQVLKNNEDNYGNIYSVDYNIGYDKKTEKSGDITFTYFISKSPYDTYHPTFIVFAEYNGDKNIHHSGLNGTFYNVDNKLIGGYGCSGGNGDNLICIIGDATDDCIFEFTAAFSATNKKEENLKDADVCETLRFCIGN